MSNRVEGFLFKPQLHWVSIILPFLCCWADATPPRIECLGTPFVTDCPEVIFNQTNVSRETPLLSTQTTAAVKRNIFDSKMPERKLVMKLWESAEENMEVTSHQPNEPTLIQLRSGPGYDYPVLGLNVVDSIVIEGINYNGNWFLVCCVEDGQSAWLANNDRPTGLMVPDVPIVAEPLPKAFVENGQPKVYDSPNINSSVTYILETGLRFDIVAQDTSGEWFEICCISDESGWIATESITLWGDSSAIPVRNENLSSPQDDRLVSSLLLNTTERSLLIVSMVVLLMVNLYRLVIIRKSKT